MKRFVFALPLLLVALFASSAEAAPLITFCPGGLQSLPQATFGGTGIPNNAVCVATIGDVTFGLTATPRFNNPPVTNNGSDTFIAEAGNDSGNGQPGYAIWNVDFFAMNNSLTNSYTAQYLFDTNPGLNTDVSQFGQFNQLLAPGQTVQDSWNLGFGFIDTGVPIPGVYSPAGTIFNPLVPGEYGFAVNAYPLGDAAARFGVGANVDVQAAPVPEPSSIALLGTGLLFGASRLRKKLFSKQ